MQVQTAVSMNAGLAHHRLLAIACLSLLLFLLHTHAAAQCQGPPTSAPTVTATAGKAQITLTWNAVSNATGYRILRSDNGGAFYGYVTASTTSYTDTFGFTNGLTYAYYIYAQNNCGYGPASNTAAAKVDIGAPGVSAQPGKAKITLTWGAVNYADGYYIAKSTDNANFTQIGSTTATNYNDTGVTNNTTYYYQVRGYNSAGYGQRSNNAPATIKLHPPAGVRATRNGDGSVTVTWGAVTDADSYVVNKSPDRVSGLPFGLNVTGTSKTDTAPLHARQLLLRLRAQQRGRRPRLHLGRHRR